MPPPRKKLKTVDRQRGARRRPAVPPYSPDPDRVPVASNLPEAAAFTDDAAFAPSPLGAEPPATLDPPSTDSDNPEVGPSRSSEPAAQSQPEAPTPETFWSNEPPSTSPPETRPAAGDDAQLLATLAEIMDQQSAFARDLSQLQAQLHNLRLQ